ncbi:MAG: hypothetical protein LBF08_07415 [Dysgonamonadaceae bacterium]|jgi:hypothetical protein|nr:hypothetical protein [Dysgonamonadaceae bacterium]
MKQLIRKFLVNLRKVKVVSIPNKRCHRNDSELVLAERLQNPIFLERYGYKVYSQNDEDGMIAEIFNRIGVTDKRFVEFGVQNGLESNAHFLIHGGWSGIWIDGDKKAVDQLRLLFRKPIESGRLLAMNAFITMENINQLIGTAGNCRGEIDLLSIDIDGNDYWIWKSVDCINPRVVVIEYNAKFPPSFEWVMEYNGKHAWQGDDQQGASLKSLELLGVEKGYRLVGTNKNGVNAFFVRRDLAKNLFPEPATAENLYNPARWDMQYVSGHPTKKYIGKS